MATNQIFQYNGSPITFQIGNALMVNATQMAKSFGKFTKDWLSNKATQEFLITLSAVRTIPLTELVVVKQGGNTQGTWMHEDVALEFARWLSPAFAIWCNDRIKELLLNGSTSLPQNPHSGELAKALDRINSLTAELNYLRGRMEAEKELAEARVRLETQKELMEVQQELMKTQRELSETRTCLQLSEMERHGMINMKRNEGIILESKIQPEKKAEPQPATEPIQSREESPASLKECKSYIYTKKAVLRRYPEAMLMREMCARLREEHRITFLRTSQLFEWMRREGYLRSGCNDFNLPSRECMDKGWMAYTRCGSAGSGVQYYTPYVTQEGYRHFAGIIVQKGGEL